jgi:hypothetical protein
MSQITLKFSKTRKQNLNFLRDWKAHEQAAHHASHRFRILFVFMGLDVSEHGSDGNELGGVVRSLSAQEKSAI